VPFGRGGFLFTLFSNNLVYLQKFLALTYVADLYIVIVVLLIQSNLLGITVAMENFHSVQV